MTRQPLTLADYAALQHLTQAEAAAKLEVTPSAVSQAAKRWGLAFRKGRRGRPSCDAVTSAPAPSMPDGPRLVPDGRPPRPARPGASAEGAMLAAPAFGTERDLKILETKGRYPKLHALATRWGMPARRVVARWHVLRAAR